MLVSFAVLSSAHTPRHPIGANIIPPSGGRSLTGGRDAYGQGNVNKSGVELFASETISSPGLVFPCPGVAGGHRHSNSRGGILHARLFFRLIGLTPCTSAAVTELKQKSSISSRAPGTHTLYIPRSSSYTLGHMAGSILQEAVRRKIQRERKRKRIGVSKFTISVMSRVRKRRVVSIGTWNTRQLGATHSKFDQYLT